MAFEQVSSPEGVVWRRSTLLRDAGIPHGFSTRLGGVSPPPFDSLNLGLADAPGEQDAWSRVQENWQRFTRAVGMDGRALVRARQVHGVGVLQPDHDATVVRVEPPFADGDALVTSDPSHAISVRVADCAPVLLADPMAGVVAAVHAGWRGTVSGIVAVAVRAMVDRGADPGRMRAAVGGCIGAKSFQVGDEVRDAFVQAGLDGAVRPDSEPGKWKADLRAALHRQLLDVGVPSSQIDVDPSCTVLDQGTQFSYRRQGARSGRMAAIIGLNLPLPVL